MYVYALKIKAYLIYAEIISVGEKKFALGLHTYEYNLILF